MEKKTIAVLIIIAVIVLAVISIEIFVSLLVDLTMCIFFGLFFGFPIFAAHRAYENGHPCWAVATLISIMIMCGPIVGLIAFRIKPTDEAGPSSPGSICGIGTIYFGATDRQSDDSIVTTKWFTFFGLPLIPLSSYRVNYLGEESSWSGAVISSSTNYGNVRSVPLNTRQVLRIYSILASPLFITSIIALPFSVISTEFGEFFVGLGFTAFFFIWLASMVYIAFIKVK